MVLVEHSKLAAILALTLVFGCSSLRVNVDYDLDEDFSGYQSFAWRERSQTAEGSEFQNPLIGRRVRAAVERELSAKGYRAVLDGTPDFYVFYHLSLEQKLDVYTVNQGYIDDWGYPVTWPETRTRRYEEGTLIIDIADAKDRQVTWRGVGVGRVNRSPTPERTTRDIDSAVADILKRFPPEKKKAS